MPKHSVPAASAIPDSATTADLQTLVDALPGAALLFDRDGSVHSINRFALAELELTAAEALGHNIATLLPPSLVDMWQVQLDAAVAQGEPVAWDQPWAGRIYRNTVIPLRDARGKVTRIAAFAEDVTATREAAARLRESEERYRLLAENSRDVIWALDLRSNRFTYVSPAVQRLRGFTPEEVMAAPVEEALTPTSREVVNRAVNAMLKRIAAGQRGDLTTVTNVDQPHRDGHIVHTEVATSYLLDEQGQPVSILGVTRDVTERRKVEAALRASEEQFRFLAENTADVVWQLDANMRFLYINGADERMRGFKREEVLGRFSTELFTPEGRATIAAKIVERREREARGIVHETMRFEAQQVRKDGSVFWVEINSTPVRDADGKTIGYNGMTRDIDQRKRQEALLEAANRELQARVQEITELQARLTEQTVRDPLSGLHNRRYLDETLPRELARAKREGYPLALIMIDLDHFKRINDTYGHQAGDSVILALADLLQGGARESDVVCRYGGEEFLVVQPGVSAAGACQRAEAWRLALAANPVRHGQFTIPASLSAGIATFPGSGAEADTLLLHADAALYQAKAAGRNRVVCHGEGD